MLTGLMFSLAQKPIVAANDVGGKAPSDGRAFPPRPPHVPQKTRKRVRFLRVTQIVSVLLAVAGLTLLALGATEWSFHPGGELRVHTALISFFLPVGASS
jgi:hypothetical protein